MPKRAIIATTAIYLLAFALGVAIVTFALHKNLGLETAMKSFEDYQRLQLITFQVLEATHDAEDSQNLYVMEKNTRELEAYFERRKDFASAMLDLENNPLAAASGILPELKRFAQLKLDDWASSVSAADRPNTTLQQAIRLAFSDKNLLFSRRIRADLQRITEASVNRFLEARIAVDTSSPPRTAAFAMMGVACALVLAGVAMGWLEWRLIDKAHAAFQARLEQAETKARLKGIFLANVSHEIRTPMNVIIGMSDELVNAPLAAEHRDIAKEVLASALALRRIIDDILLFSKIEASKLSLIPAVFHLRKFLHSVYVAMSVRARSKNLRFKFDVADDVPEQICADETRLRQVLYNLIDNAVKYTDAGFVGLNVYLIARNGSPPHTTCTGKNHVGFDDRVSERKTTAVATSYGDRKVILIGFEVYDTGVGISEAGMQKLFQPFQQVLTSQLTESGTGLGLAITSELVFLMGGQIEVRSQPGKGSCFSFPICCPATLSECTSRPVPSVIPHVPGIAVIGGRDGIVANTLPLQIQTNGGGGGGGGGDTACSSGSTPPMAPPAAHTAVTHPKEEMAASAPLSVPDTGTGIEMSRSLRVLVADDDTGNKKLLRRQLKKHKVTICDDGRQVVDAFTSNPAGFDIILMDIHMPTLNGLDATRAIREYERTHNIGRRIPILAITAGVLDYQHCECAKAGMDAILSKPIMREDLEAALAKFVPV